MKIAKITNHISWVKSGHVWMESIKTKNKKQTKKTQSDI